MNDAETNLLRNANVCTGRTTSNAAKLIRCKDMARPRNTHEEHLPDGISSKDVLDRGGAKTKPTDRLRQRGFDTTMNMLNDLVRGISLPQQAPVIVIDWLPTAAGDWGSVVRAIALKQLDCPPRIVNAGWMSCSLLLRFTFV